MTETFLKSIIGKDKEQCGEMCKMNGFTCRVIREDNSHFACTLDFHFKRINVEIDNGIVTGYHKG